MVFHDVLDALFASGQYWEPSEHRPKAIFLTDMIGTYVKKNIFKYITICNFVYNTDVKVELSDMILSVGQSDDPCKGK